MLINSTGGEGGDEEGEEEEEVCVVGSVEYYVDFCLDWRGVPVREVGGGVNGGKRIEWEPNEETAVLYPAALQLPIHNRMNLPENDCKIRTTFRFFIFIPIHFLREHDIIGKNTDRFLCILHPFLSLLFPYWDCSIIR